MTDRALLCMPDEPAAEAKQRINAF